mmetsp:Transcript_66303/g.175617  ORF Transcript_66303/g.175617 Transcript_66303/m.175617 type:complete len:89 (-) Transcript_66303:205-471(-)
MRLQTAGSSNEKPACALSVHQARSLHHLSPGEKCLAKETEVTFLLPSSVIWGVSLATQHVAMVRLPMISVRSASDTALRLRRASRRCT